MSDDPRRSTEPSGESAAVICPHCGTDMEPYGGQPDLACPECGFGGPDELPDYDDIAAELGMPADWREIGFDTPNTMDEMYRLSLDSGAMLCPFPQCKFTRRDDVEAMFRHVHGPSHSDSSPKRTRCVCRHIEKCDCGASSTNRTAK